MLKDIIKIFNEENNFILTCHVQPDGDGIGSALALGKALLNSGKNVSIIYGDDKGLPTSYRFLPGFDLFTSDAPDFDSYIFVALDCANVERLGDLKDMAFESKLLVNIDHHPDNSNYGDINLVEPEASSCAELIYKVLRVGEYTISHDIALCLYVGMVTDTGRWQYSNTNAHALRVAAELIECGVNPNYVFQNIYEKNTLPRLKITGLGLGKAVFMPELKFIYTVITREELNEVGAGVSDTESLVDWLRGVEGAMTAAVIKETFNDNIKVSLRSKGEIDVSAIAALFNGGGHKNAAGFVSHKSLSQTVDSLISTVEKTQTVTNSLI
ncbi:MAG TPA: bifunctional oligoribonuclease/PAP phosphatase NrnA [Actinobacteria bacterium]|nr:bifunctional oligoribonuclease/PAP phosphatase NrnA [Actinomycetes bacterium]HEX21167.1 bifunctional oligoribonuclease/PAP phosphatase NrnA [Actinomycetota bacterium]